MNAHITLRQISNGYIVEINGFGPYPDPDTGAAKHYSNTSDLIADAPNILQAALDEGPKRCPRASGGSIRNA